MSEEIIGRGERIRTSDPSVPNRVLYQAEPRPDGRILSRRRLDRARSKAPGSWFQVLGSWFKEAQCTSDARLNFEPGTRTKNPEPETRNP